MVQGEKPTASKRTQKVDGWRNVSGEFGWGLGTEGLRMHVDPRIASLLGQTQAALSITALL